MERKEIPMDVEGLVRQLCSNLGEGECQLKLAWSQVEMETSELIQGIFWK